MNVTILGLLMSSMSHSPLISPPFSVRSVSIQKSSFSRFASNFYRSIHGNEAFFMRSTKFSSFLTAPLHFSSDDPFCANIFRDFTFDQRLTLWSTSTNCVVLEECSFHHCVADLPGASIYFARNSFLKLYSSTFVNCVSRTEAAILYLRIGTYYSTSPLNISYCFFERCYTTGELFTPTSDTSQPSVLIHDYISYSQASNSTSRITYITALECMENKESNKRFGGLIHHHANQFSIFTYNATSHGKIDSSHFVFTQYQTMESRIQYALAYGQTGISVFQIADILASVSLVIQYALVLNTTLLTSFYSDPTSTTYEDFTLTQMEFSPHSSLHVDEITDLSRSLNDIYPENTVSEVLSVAPTNNEQQEMSNTDKLQSIEPTNLEISSRISMDSGMEEISYSEIAISEAGMTESLIEESISMNTLNDETLNLEAINAEIINDETSNLETINTETIIEEKTNLETFSELTLIKETTNELTNLKTSLEEFSVDEPTTLELEAEHYNNTPLKVNAISQKSQINSFSKNLLNLKNHFTKFPKNNKLKVIDDQLQAGSHHHEAYGMIQISGQITGTIVFISSHFINIYTDNPLYLPNLVYSTSSKSPNFAHCLTNSESLALNYNGIKFTNLPEDLIIPQSRTQVLVPSNINPSSPTDYQYVIDTIPYSDNIDQNRKQNDSNLSNAEIVGIAIGCNLVIIIIIVIVARSILRKKLSFETESLTDLEISQNITSHGKRKKSIQILT